MMEYKIIRIAQEGISSLYNLLLQVFGSYPKEDFYFEIENNNLLIYLRQLDMVDFRKRVQTFIAGTDNQLAREILKEVLHKIESIGSYGLKGRKRLFVGYDKERKVREAKKGKGKRRLFLRERK